jgi:DNA-binding NarL/FixJ family response regulator
MSRVPSTVRSRTPCGSILICRGIPEFPREQEVLDGVLQSLASKEIASKLNVAVRTVKFHVSSLLAKFGVTNRITLGREVSH